MDKIRAGRFERPSSDNKINALLEEMGDCYQAAGRLIMEYISNGKLVHGMVNGQGRLNGIRFGHAWVEVGGKVLDHSNGQKRSLPKEVYYALGRIKPSECKYYKYQDAAKLMASKGHWGPWEMSGDTVNAGKYTKIVMRDRELVSILQGNGFITGALEVMCEYLDTVKAEGVSDDHEFVKRLIHYFGITSNPNDVAWEVVGFWMGVQSYLSRNGENVSDKIMAENYKSIMQTTAGLRIKEELAKTGVGNPDISVFYPNYGEELLELALAYLTGSQMANGGVLDKESAINYLSSNLNISRGLAFEIEHLWRSISLNRGENKTVDRIMAERGCTMADAFEIVLRNKQKG